MAWNHVADETTRAPAHAVRYFTDKHGQMMPYTTSEPTGEYVETTHSIWRCGSCRALATTNKGYPPSGPCRKCGAGT